MWSLNETYCASSRSRASRQWWWVMFPKITDRAWVAQEYISIIMLDPHAMSSLVRHNLIRFNHVIEWFHILFQSQPQEHSMFYTYYYIWVKKNILMLFKTIKLCKHKVERKTNVPLLNKSYFIFKLCKKEKQKQKTPPHTFINSWHIHTNYYILLH